MSVFGKPLYALKVPPADMDGEILEKWNNLPNIVSSQEELDVACADLEKIHEKLKNNSSPEHTTTSENWWDDAVVLTNLPDGYDHWDN
jgi:hypothetical protein